VAGFCEYGIEPSGSIKGWDFLDLVRENSLLHGAKYVLLKDAVVC